MTLLNTGLDQTDEKIAKDFVRLASIATEVFEAEFKVTIFEEGKSPRTETKKVKNIPGLDQRAILNILAADLRANGGFAARNFDSSRRC